MLSRDGDLGAASWASRSRCDDGLTRGHPGDHDVEERADQQADDPEQDGEVGLHEDDLSPAGPERRCATRRQPVYSSHSVVFTTL